MRMFRDRKRSGAPDPAGDPGSRGPGGGSAWLDRARMDAARHVDEAAERASRAASTGHTWSTRERAAPGPTVHRPLASYEPEIAPAEEPDQEERHPDQPAPEAMEDTARSGQSSDDGEVSSALARHGAEAFAARARLAAHQSNLPRRRQVWQLDDDEEDEAADPADVMPEPEMPAPERAAGRARSGAMHDPQPAQGDWLDRIDRRERVRSVPRRTPRPVTAVPGRSADTGEDHDMADEAAYARAQLARMAELGPGGQGAGDAGGARAKTRVLGFRAPEAADDPFSRGASAAPGRGPDHPVGWLVVTAGAGRGASFALTSGVATLGRGQDQTVSLDFGDTAISRHAHASVAFDEETGRFFLGAGAKSNIVRRNGRPVLATEELENGDEIRLGETTLRLVALCGPDFSWDDQPAEGA